MDIKQQEGFKFKDCISKITVKDSNNWIAKRIFTHLDPVSRGE